MISVGQLCVDDVLSPSQKKNGHPQEWKTTFTRTKKYKWWWIMGYSHHEGTFWIYLIHQTKESIPHAPLIRFIIYKVTTSKDVTLYIHAMCFSPAKHTFLKVIQNKRFLGWPESRSDWTHHKSSHFHYSYNQRPPKIGKARPIINQTRYYGNKSSPSSRHVSSQSTKSLQKWQSLHGPY